MTSIKLDLTSSEPYITPAEVYSGSDFNINKDSCLKSISAPPLILLRKATGGAGQSGLIRAWQMHLLIPRCSKIPVHGSV